jgi:phage terminase large subunit-like protein
MKLPETGLTKLDQYCYDVKNGHTDVCRWVRLAVDRHYSDLARASKDNKFLFHFSPETAANLLFFCQDKVTHYEGVMRGKPLILEPWQFFVYGSIFGWLNDDKFQNYDIRRFRTATIIVPKKQGKSMMAGAVPLFMLKEEGWPGAQCYILAKNQTHAKDLGYRAATIMAENSPEVSKYVKINYSAAGCGIYCKSNNSFYKPITSKPESEDGRNVYFCGPDETKDWTDFEIYEVMKNGTVNNPNSLFMSTTTAGTDLLSLGYDQQKYLEKVLRGDIVDETTFGVIYTIDEEDKLDKKGKPREDWWYDMRVLKKANPNFGISVFENILDSLITEAKQSPSKRTAFQTKHLNIWHASSEEFITEAKWDRCGGKKMLPVMKNLDKILESYRGRECFGGLDLGSVSDFTAFILEFIDPYEVIPLFWIPRDTIPDRKGSAMIRAWVEQGWIEATEGDWTDHDFTEQAIIKIHSIVDLKELPYDLWGMES